MKKRQQLMNRCILVLLFAANFVHAQNGFLNIACGSKSNFTDNRGLVWVPDTNYIQLGQAQRVSKPVSSYFVYMKNLRKFPKPLNKSCYGIPWSSTHPFRLRLSFYNKNWPGVFNYSVETTDMLYESVKLNGSYYEYEQTLVTMGTMVYICLNRMSEAADPFISAIQMIKFKHGMYRWAKPQVMLVLLASLDIGGEAAVRYPNDNFDRIWYSSNMSTPAILKSTSLEIDANATAEVPPSAVMQTAEMLDSSAPVVFPSVDPNMKVLLLLYLSEIDKSSESVSFSVSNALTGKMFATNETLVRNYTAVEIPIQPEVTSQNYEIRLQALDGKSMVPLNALEIYGFANKKQGTAREDVKALNDLKNTQTSNSLTKYWVSDPCFIVPWRYISCTRDMRVSHLYLSGKNFSGYLPQSLGNLTALVYLDLSNNSFEGPLPDLSNLIWLEAINVSNNKLNDTLESLVKLTKHKLQKVFVQNNNFSGEIPRELEQLGARNFSYSGNPYLHNPTTKTKNHAVIIGATIGGVLLLLIVITILIIFYPRKKPIVKFMDQKPSSSVVIPHSSKCRSFSMEEMRLATQDFSQEIGRGGFGFVYYGQLPEGVEIAVKVLSVFSHQGTDEFLNEVVILSGLNHTSLVKLLGFCSDADELMLVYEYMPLGSLKDHLSGSKKATVDLSWKDRLQIAIDAACGLEYLHLDCNPRIVHRDLKSANILLDHNLNGKLSDLGLSRVFKDEDTHVTTTVKGTAGYLDPEYFNMHVLTEKSDVYSLGVVLLELVCGRAPIDQKLGEDQINLVRWVKPYVEREDPEELKLVMDWRLKGRFGTMRSIAIVSRLAMRCLEMEPSARPDAREVVQILREAMEIETEARAEAESLHSSAPKDGDSATGSSYSHNVDSVGSSDNYGINRTPASS